MTNPTDPRDLEAAKARLRAVGQQGAAATPGTPATPTAPVTAPASPAATPAPPAAPVAAATPPVPTPGTPPAPPVGAGTRRPSGPGSRPRSGGGPGTGSGRPRPAPAPSPAAPTAPMPPAPPATPVVVGPNWPVEQPNSRYFKAELQRYAQEVNRIDPALQSLAGAVRRDRLQDYLEHDWGANLPHYPVDRGMIQDVLDRMWRDHPDGLVAAAAPAAPTAAATDPAATTAPASPAAAVPAERQGFTQRWSQRVRTAWANPDTGFRRRLIVGGVLVLVVLWLLANEKTLHLLTWLVGVPATLLQHFWIGTHLASQVQLDAAGVGLRDEFVHLCLIGLGAAALWYIWCRWLSPALQPEKPVRRPSKKWIWVLLLAAVVAQSLPGPSTPGVAAKPASGPAAAGAAVPGGLESALQQCSRQVDHTVNFYKTMANCLVELSNHLPPALSSDPSGFYAKALRAMAADAWRMGCETAPESRGDASAIADCAASKPVPKVLPTNPNEQ